MRGNIEEISMQNNSDVTKMTYQIKKILDYINERLNELTNVKNSEIDALIIRAYNVPERLV